jgi:histone deacetylase 11
MPTPSNKVVYHPGYNVTFFGFERLHPFDGRKYGRAYRLLRRQFGRRALARMTLRPRRPISRGELLAVHPAEYLDKLRNPAFVAGVLELPPLAKAPGWLADWRVLRPMRLATAGTVLAAQYAMGDTDRDDHDSKGDDDGSCGANDRRGTVVMNLGGGYHHASPPEGHGFSAYADVGLAVDRLRRPGPAGEPARLGPDDRVVYVDLDAHQGNGVCRTFFDDRRVLIFDAYNRHIFPLDVKAQRRVDHDLPLSDGCPEAEYLRAVTTDLPRFLDAVCRRDGDGGTGGGSGRVRLAIYNAGTDPYEGDQLGRLRVSADGIFERDRFVIDQFAGRGLPTVVLTSGGYSGESYQMVARTAAYVLDGGAG